MAPSSRAKRRKSVPSAMEKALDKEAARQEKKNKRKRGGKKRSKRCRCSKTSRFRQ